METVMIAGGCNRSPSAISWSRTCDRVAFACGSVIAVGNPDRAIIESTAIGHDPAATVTAVSWVDAPASHDGTFVIFSAASDGVLHQWAYNPIERSFRLDAKLTGHLASITSLSTGIIADTLIATTTSSDGTVRIWHSATCSQVIKCASLPLCTAIVELDGRVILAVGDVASKVTLFERDGDHQFVRAIVLDGHEDWVRSLDFNVDDRSCWLASGSQDTYIRLWRIAVGDDNALQIELESVMSGHEDFVLSVKWRPGGGREMALLSASMDKTMIIWALEGDLWVPVTHTGEVGGHSLACYCADWNPRGDAFIGNTYSGGFYLWRQTPSAPIPWQTSPVWSGHASPVADLAWHPAGQYIVSVGEDDQTTRVFAPWVDCPLSDSDSTTFHEMSRPQIHGHDLTCICSVPSVPHRFVSGAHEKVLRVFDAPRTFLADLRTLSHVIADDDDRIERAECVVVPELGLSNKAVTDEHGVYEMHQPPIESVLMQDKLWPEVAKLYGHGNELHAVCSSHDGYLLASSCSSKDAKHAALIIWCTSTWTQLQSLPAHGLTAIQLEFSPDDRFLLSVSRDRSIGISARSSSSSSWSTTMLLPLAHQRIIWSCSWAHDGAYFATGSRDKTIHIWKVVDIDGRFTLDSTVRITSAVTAVAFTDNYLLAVGSESGQVRLYQGKSGATMTWAIQGEPIQAHSGTIRRIAWRPFSSPMLATCGNDHTVRLFNVKASL